VSAERLIELAAGWEALAATMLAASHGCDEATRANLTGQAQARVECATALRNLTTDMETDMDAVIYSTPLADGQILQRAGLTTATPGLVVDTPLFPCHDFGDPCWTVLHVRSGRPFPFCWDSQGAALEMAEQCAEFGPWQDGEDAAVQRMKEHRKAVSRLAYDLGGRIHDFPAPSRGGIDNGAVA
jgi:hypothetical protein